MVTHKWQTIIIIIASALVAFWLMWYAVQTQHYNPPKNDIRHPFDDHLTGWLGHYYIGEQPIQITFHTGEPNIPYSKSRSVIPRSDYFRDAPLFSYRDLIVAESESAGVDFHLVMAQAILESRGGMQTPAKGNWWGRKCQKTTWCSWETPEEGIKDQIQYSKWLLSSCNGRLDCYSARYAEAKDYQKRVEAIMATL